MIWENWSWVKISVFFFFPVVIDFCTGLTIAGFNFKLMPRTKVSKPGNENSPGLYKTTRLVNDWTLGIIVPKLVETKHIPTINVARFEHQGLLRGPSIVLGH